MLWEEFERLAGKEVTQEEYEIIETVYMDYPGFNEKEQIVNLFKAHGMLIFRDLYPRAKTISEKNSKIRDLQKEIEFLKTGCV